MGIVVPQTQPPDHQFMGRMLVTQATSATWLVPRLILCGLGIWGAKCLRSVIHQSRGLPACCVFGQCINPWSLSTMSSYSGGVGHRSNAVRVRHRGTVPHGHSMGHPPPPPEANQRPEHLADKQSPRPIGKANARSCGDHLPSIFTQCVLP